MGEDPGGLRLTRRAFCGLPLGGAVLALAACGPSVPPETTDPQYLSVNKTDTGGGPGLYWYQQSPSSFTQAGVTEILNLVGTRGGPLRKLAFAYSFSYLNYPLADELACIKTMLSLATSNDLPVVLHLDGVNWWSARPDLWNWWDSSTTGYSPQNRTNVEWSDWGESNAVMIGWRNWGSQIRVSPHPNLASPAFLAAQYAKLKALIPPIMDWYRGLAPARRYLLAGVILGWEVSTFINAYYYPQGNAIYQRWPDTSAHDPTGGPNASVPLGYAALTSMGKTHAGPITVADMDSVIAYYLDHITELAAQLGVPRTKLWTHCIINTIQSTGLGALTPYAQPGWSFYGVPPAVAADPINQLAHTPWGAVEFQPTGLSAPLFNEFYTAANCRMINIYNWESIRGDPAALAAVRAALEAGPQTLVQPATQLGAEVHGRRVVLSWVPGPGATSTQLQIAKQAPPAVSGTFTQGLALQRDVSQVRHLSVTLPPGRYTWLLVSGGTQGERVPTGAQALQLA